MKELTRGLELLINGTVTDKLTFLFRIYDKDGKHLTILTNKLTWLLSYSCQRKI